MLVFELSKSWPIISVFDREFSFFSKILLLFEAKPSNRRLHLPATNHNNRRRRRILSSVPLKRLGKEKFQKSDIKSIIIFLHLANTKYPDFIMCRLHRWETFSFFFKKMGQPCLLFHLYLVFSDKQYNSSNKSMWKCHVHPVYSARIWTPDLWNMSHLPLPLDKGSRTTFCFISL